MHHLASPAPPIVLASVVPNVLVITSDQHNKAVLGCAGDSHARTPNIDLLAARGTTFSAAYTNNPICMPARATLATGRYGHTMGTVDNGSPYVGDEADSWGRRLGAQGFQVPTFGKLHFDAEGESGYDERLPLHAKRGYFGALTGWARGRVSPNDVLKNQVLLADVGEFEYTAYDQYTAHSAAKWLDEEASRDRPWAAYVSFAYPHYPFRVPREFVAGTTPGDIPLPSQWAPDQWPDHHELNWRREAMNLHDGLTEEQLRQMRWIYYGMVAFLDHQVGIVLDALEVSGMADDTIVIYSTDHGDMLGEKGLIMKSLMYESSAGVPMIMAGPDVREGVVLTTPVSLADVYPTVIDGVGGEFTEGDADLPGTSLLMTAAGEPDSDRVVFSEYHGPLSIGASYMIRSGRWKYVDYCDDQSAPQLFDLESDPAEEADLGMSADHAAVRAGLDRELRTILDPEAVDRQIRSAQWEQLQDAGGLERIRPRGPAPMALGGYSVPSDEIMEIVRAGLPETFDPLHRAK